MVGDSTQLKGTLISIAGVLVLSPDALMIRLVGNEDSWNVQFYRYMLQGLVLLAFYLVSTRGNLIKFFEIGKIGLLAGLIWGVSNLIFTMAIQRTAVANVLVILAGGNLTFSSLLSLLFLKEMIPTHTIVACTCCFGAILLVFSDQLEGRSTSWEGNVLAIFAALTLALYFVLVRLAGRSYGREPDMIPCNIIAGLFVGFISLILGAKPSAVLPNLTCLYLVLQGCILLPLAFALLTIGPSLIPAPEVSMIMLIETLLGPVWVFLAGYEAPPANTIWGGIILIVSLVAHSVLALIYEARERARREEKEPGVDLIEGDDVWVDVEVDSQHCKEHIPS